MKYAIIRCPKPNYPQSVVFGPVSKAGLLLKYKGGH